MYNVIHLLAAHTRTLQARPVPRLLHALQELLDLLALELPREPREAERVADTRVRDVAEAPDGLELRVVDHAALVQHVVAHVDALHEPEDERRGDLPAGGVDDVDGLEELEAPMMKMCTEIFGRASW